MESALVHSYDDWDSFIRGESVAGWLEEYDALAPWVAEILEIPQGPLTYLFDSTPTMSGADTGDDRVVAVWGRSVAVAAPRDSSRQAGFIPVPAKWSHIGMDRGHFVAHAAGGGMDINFFPQAQGLNRGTTERGKVWKAMEREIVTHPGTPFFVRPVYEDGTWVPTLLDYGVLVDAQLWEERFQNRDG